MSNENFVSILNAIEASAVVTRRELKEYIEKENEKVLNKLDEEKRKIAALQGECQSLQNRQLRFKRLHRRNNILVFGLERDENQELFPFLISFFQSKLDVTLTTFNVNNAYCLKSTDNKKTTPIKMEFVNYWKNDLIFKQCKKLKGTNIFIAEDLCLEDR